MKVHSNLPALHALKSLIILEISSTWPKTNRENLLGPPSSSVPPNRYPKELFIPLANNSWFRLYSQISSPLVREERLALCHPSGAAGIIISVHGFEKHFRSPQNLSFFSEKTSEEDLCSAHTS